MSQIQTKTRPMRSMTPSRLGSAYPSPHFYPRYQAYPPASFFPPQAGWPYVPQATPYQPQSPAYQQIGYLPDPEVSSTALVLRDAKEPGPSSSSTEDSSSPSSSPGPSSPGPSPSRALVRYQLVRRDTPAEYPCPPMDDPDNPAVPIHPYLYNEFCPVDWDMRKNFRSSARKRRLDGLEEAEGEQERLSAIALKANAISAAGVNHKMMKIIFSDETFPWAVNVQRESGLVVGEVIGEIATMLDMEITEPERIIATEARLGDVEDSKVANEGTVGLNGVREAGGAMKRVDWLGTKTRYGGLVHSSAKDFQDLVRRRIHQKDRPNTWVLIAEERT